MGNPFHDVLRRRRGRDSAPGCVVSSASSDPIITTFDVTFTFTEDVDGFAVGDITVTNGSAGSFVAVSGSVYTATITPTAAGEVGVSVAAGVCVDASGRANLASNTLSLQAHTFDVTTTAPAQTLTIKGLTVSASTTVYWGDGNSDAYTGSGTRTHVYADAGTWHVTIAQPANVGLIDLRDAKITLNSRNLRQLTTLTSLRLENVVAVFDSADFVGKPLVALALSALPSGSLIDFDSADFVGMPLSTFILGALPAGVSITLAAADFAGWVTMTTLSLNDARLTSAQCDAVLNGLYLQAGLRTATGGTVNIAGANNGTASGTYADECPTPTTPKGKAFEMFNALCVWNATKKWTTLTMN